MKKMNIKNKKLFIGLVVIFTKIANFVHGDSFVTKISNSYLKSFQSDQEEDFDINKVASRGKLKKVTAASLSERKKLDVVFNIILAESNYFSEIYSSLEDVMHEYSWKDLHIFYGTTTDPRYTIFNKINKTSTKIGKAFFASMLVSPCSDIESLKNRQSLVLCFYKNYDKSQNINSIIKKYSEIEDNFLSFFTDKDPLYSTEYIKYMESYYYGNIEKESSLNSSILQAKKIFFRDFWGITYKISYPFIHAAISDICSSIFSSKGLSKEGRSFAYKGAIPFWGVYEKYKILDEQAKSFGSKGLWDSTQGKFSFIFLGIIPELAYTYSFYAAIDNYIIYSNTLSNLADRLSDIQTVFKTLKSISEYFSSNEELEKVYGHKLKEIRKLLSLYDQKTEEGKLVTYMMDLPFKKWSYFVDNAGKLLASFTLFIKYKQILYDALTELGELDSYISVAKIIKESEDYCQDKKFIFSKILDKKDYNGPYLKIENMWNPMIDAKVAVVNEVEMKESLRNIILTGPNAGGKSVYLTGIATSVLLAQSFGIAPAKEMVITPFRKICTYIEIADDLAEESSLFKAEVKRAQSHFHMLKTLKKEDYVFTIFDEPFNGTNPKEGAAAEYSIMKVLSKNENTFNIVATHFPIMTLLEKSIPEGAFANYKVYILEGKKNLEYTYKVIPGSSNQTIAIRILEEQGFDTSLLQRAKDIVSNPQKYQANF